ncbi:MAG: M23 family metallopeptidase [Patescibacteria group bacterium]
MKTLTSGQIAEVIKVIRPVKKSKVSQGFGPSPYSKLQAWYTSFGWRGHNGIDFVDMRGTPCQATTSGVITKVYSTEGAGNIVALETDWMQYGQITFKLRFYYLHLLKALVKAGDKVVEGQDICQMDNTGHYTTGTHLHFHCVPVYRVGYKEVIDSANGYDGAVNPAPMFKEDHWDKIPVESFYGKKRNWILEYTFRFANTPLGTLLTPFLSERIKAARFVHKKLMSLNRIPPLLTDQETNALIYGSWDLETVLDPALFIMWGWYTKKEVIDAKAEGRELKSPLFAGGDITNLLQ